VGFSGAWLDLVGLDRVVRQRVAMGLVNEALEAMGVPPAQRVHAIRALRVRLRVDTLYQPINRQCRRWLATGARLSPAACSGPRISGGDSATADATMDGATTDAAPSCGRCSGRTWTACTEDGLPANPVECPLECANGRGCVPCVPGQNACVGNEVRRCGENGEPTSEVLQTCDANAGMICNAGACASACQVAEAQSSNVGCEFWAVDLDQQDAINDGDCIADHRETVGRLQRERRARCQRHESE
jgi:hypothetical protein